MKRVVKQVSWFVFLIGLFYLFVLVINNQRGEEMILTLIAILLSLVGLYSTRDHSTSKVQDDEKGRFEEIFNNPHYDDSESDDDDFDIDDD